MMAATMRSVAVPLRVGRRTEYVPIDGAIEYDPRGRWPWLQRRLLATLGWLGARPPTRAVDRWQEAAINLDDLARAVAESREDLMRVYRKEAEYLVVGRDRMADLMRAVDPATGMHVLAFPTDYTAPVVVAGRRCDGVFQGMKVVFVPWIEGMFLLPELA